MTWRPNGGAIPAGSPQGLSGLDYQVGKPMETGPEEDPYNFYVGVKKDQMEADNEMSELR